MFIEDLDGHKARPVEFAAQVAAASNRPVIGVHGTWIGRGVVGGHVVDYSAVGRAVATAIRGVLDGALAGATPDADSTEWQFDARQLARWRIDERDLPPGSRVLYREPSAWERYRVQIVILAAGIGLQTLIIAGLVVERRARRKAMAALRDEEARRQRAEFHARVQLHEQSHVRTMAAMGQMAATMAHEMNQPLAAALGNAQALRRMIERAGLRDQDIIDTLTDVISQNKRAGDVVQRIRTLARKGSVEFGPVDLDQLADEVAGLVTVEAKHAGVPIVVHRSPQGAVAHGDRVQLLQVLLNVVQNAIQAGNGYAGARVSLMVEVDESADRVSVTVADSGPGIAPDLLPRLFEPFFTTKPDGLGLGLAICRAIVDLHGGDIRVRNLASSGAEIAVRLPRHSGGPA
jgi:signal transduction histidine kinase